MNPNQPNPQKSTTDFGQQLAKKKQSDHALSSNSSSSDDEVDVVQVKKAINTQRQSVSAEAYGKFNKKENFKPKIIPKSEDQKQRIKQRLNQAFMFSVLDDKEREIIIYAMEEKKFKKGDWVIRQGEQGDNLYVVDSGELDCFKKYTNEPADKYLKTYVPGESFGELALLFQSPRAASIQVKSELAVLWQLDRETFNMIVKEASIKKREKYENFLNTWQLLSGMDDPYEKMKMSDALHERSYKKGEVIAQTGRKIEFFIVDEGAVGAIKDNQQKFQFDKQGDYFGDISCTLNRLEPFQYVALADTKLYYITRASFTSTLIIVKAKLEQRIQEVYQEFIN